MGAHENTHTYAYNSKHRLHIYICYIYIYIYICISKIISLSLCIYVEWPKGCHIPKLMAKRVPYTSTGIWHPFGHQVLVYGTLLAIRSCPIASNVPVLAPSRSAPSNQEGGCSGGPGNWIWVCLGMTQEGGPLAHLGPGRDPSSVTLSCP